MASEKLKAVLRKLPKIFLFAFVLAWAVTVMVSISSGSESWVYIPLAGFNFIVHEAGHQIGAISGTNLIEALSGTFFEVFVVVGLIIWLVGRKEAVATVFASAWTVFTFVGIGRYMSDAVAQELPLYTLSSLKGVSVHPLHDWQVIFSDFQIIEYADGFGLGVSFVGILFAVPVLITGIKQITSALN